MLWGFIRFFALGLFGLAVLLGLTTLFGPWGFAVAIVLALVWALPAAKR